MYKYKNLEEELHSVYKKLTPTRICKIAKKKYKQKIESINTVEIDKTYEKRQEEIIDNLMEINPVAVLLGYIYALEEFALKHDPEIKNILINNKVKNQILKEDEAHRVRIFINLEGAVDQMKIKKLIEESRKNNISHTDFIQSLEDLMQEAWPDRKVK
jgi:uncharacterized membrane-anchored protein YjiN (DUF445 family)